MALKAKLENLEGVTDAHKALYRKEGDAYLLDVEPVEGYVLENVTALKGALAKEREQAAERGKALEAFGDLDPGTARDALTKVGQMKNWSSDEKVKEQIEARGKEVAAAKDAEYGPKLQALDSVRKAYEVLTIDNALRDAGVKAKFLAPALVPRLLRDAVKLDEREGKLTPVVMDANGKPRVVINNDGTSRDMSIDEFVAEQAKLPEYLPLIAGSTASGSTGSAGSQQQFQRPEGPQALQPPSPSLNEDAALRKYAESLAQGG